MKPDKLLQKELDELVNIADVWFSRFIRLRDCDDNGMAACYTCGRVYNILSMDNGHFKKRQRKATRYSEVNCNTQCTRCNKYLNGNDGEYRKHLTEEHGEEAVAVLDQMALERFDYDKEYLIDIIVKYRQLANDLLKNKMFGRWW